MKKLLIISILFMTLGLSACSIKDISNADVQKLNQKAAEYMEAGEYEKAIARLESITDLNPDFYETYYNLGVAYYQLQKYDEAIVSFNTAIDKKNDLADAYFSRAVAYEDWAYFILEPVDMNYDDSKVAETITNEDKAKANECLKNAKSDYEHYLKISKDNKDQKEIEDKIAEIDKKLNGETEKQQED